MISVIASVVYSCVLVFSFLFLCWVFWKDDLSFKTPPHVGLGDSSFRGQLPVSGPLCGWFPGPFSRYVHYDIGLPTRWVVARLFVTFCIHRILLEILSHFVSSFFPVVVLPRFDPAFLQPFFYSAEGCSCGRGCISSLFAYS